MGKAAAGWGAGVAARCGRQQRMTRDEARRRRQSAAPRLRARAQSRTRRQSCRACGAAVDAWRRSSGVQVCKPVSNHAREVTIFSNRNKWTATHVIASSHAPDARLHREGLERATDRGHALLHPGGVAGEGGGGRALLDLGLQVGAGRGGGHRQTAGHQRPLRAQQEGRLRRLHDAPHAGGGAVGAGGGPAGMAAGCVRACDERGSGHRGRRGTGIGVRRAYGARRAVRRGTETAGACNVLMQKG